MSDTDSSSLSISSTGASDGGRYTVTITNDLGTDLQSATVSIEGESASVFSGLPFFFFFFLLVFLFFFATLIATIKGLWSPLGV